MQAESSGITLGRNRRSCRARSDDLQAHQHPLSIRQVPDDLANRYRQAANQRGNCDDLMVSCKCGVLHEVNHFNMVGGIRMVVAYLFQVRNRRKRFWGLPGHIEPQVDRLLPGFLGFRFRRHRSGTPFLAKLAYLLGATTLSHSFAVELQFCFALALFKS